MLDDDLAVRADVGLARVDLLLCQSRCGENAGYGKTEVGRRGMSVPPFITRRSTPRSDGLGGRERRRRNTVPGAGALGVPARRLNHDPRASGALAGSLGLARPALIGGMTQERSQRIRACLIAHATDLFTYFIDGAL